MLVDKSLVSVEPGPTAGEPVYRVLDPIKAFGVRALVAAGEEQAARDRHLQWVLHAVDRVHTGADGEPVTLSTYPIDSLATEVRAATVLLDHSVRAVELFDLAERVEHLEARLGDGSREAQP